MGQRGPKKTPAALKKQRGTYRADRDAEVEFAAAVPECPENLHPQAAAEWRRLAPVLAQRGLLSEVDWIAWELGMAAYSTWLEASAAVAEGGAILWSDKGNPIQNPMVAIARNAGSAALKFCREFGLTPSARSGLKLDAGGKEDDPFERMMQERAE